MRRQTNSANTAGNSCSVTGRPAVRTPRTPRYVRWRRWRRRLSCRANASPDAERVAPPPLPGILWICLRTTCVMPHASERFQSMRSRSRCGIRSWPLRYCGGKPRTASHGRAVRGATNAPRSCSGTPRCVWTRYLRLQSPSASGPATSHRDRYDRRHAAAPEVRERCRSGSRVAGPAPCGARRSRRRGQRHRRRTFSLTVTCGATITPCRMLAQFSFSPARSGSCS